MNNEEVIQLLQKRRHDDLNELQLIKAYFTMEKYEQLNVKLDDSIQKIMLEQKLFSLSVPKFSLFIMQFNYKHSNARLTYDIHIDYTNLSHVDVQLHSIGHIISTYLSELVDYKTLYLLNILFNETSCKQNVNVSFDIQNLANNQVNDLQTLIEQHEMQFPIKYDLKDNSMVINIII